MPIRNFHGSTPLSGAVRLRGDDIEPADVQCAPLRKGLELWRHERGSRLFPSRQQMTPRVLGSLLYNMMLIKVVDGGREFQVRIIGDAIVAVDSDPIQGMMTASIDKLLPGFGAMLHRNYSTVCARRAPLAMRGQFYDEANERLFFREHLILPLGETDDTVDHIISIIAHMQTVTPAFLSRNGMT
ncbi:MAG: PAS domain-containing protein [Alphaproteobacteria bacterium]|nr:PAS domain-containing protein [Alphaproteobacteria bacterium]